jgi:plastocyanin
MLPSRLATPRSLALLVLGAVAGGCGSETGGPGPNPSGQTIEKASPSGDLQVGGPGQQLPAPLRVVIRSGAAPVADKTVSWQPASGSVNPTSSTTGSDGIATTTVTLPQGGTMTIQANASGVSGGPVTFTALVAGSAATVNVLNNRFSPEIAAVRAGGSVTFDWPAGSLQHNLIPDDGKAIPNDPTVRDGPFSVTVVFPTAGDYYYHCSVHGGTRSGMFGRIIVAP